MPPTKRINAWSSPRNVSTAFMYAFAQREDTQVFDEPLYAHFLSKTTTEARHPASQEILASQEQDGEKVVRDILLGAHQKPVAFFKQMAHHLIQLDEGFLFQMDNILLIRDPRAIIASYSKVIPNPSQQDVGVVKMYELYQKLKAGGSLAAVIDSSVLLSDPRRVLRELCRRLAIPFEERMLSWPAGPRPEDGIWARHWYSNVHRTTGFAPYQERRYQLPSHLEKLAESCRPYYETLYQASIQL